MEGNILKVRGAGGKPIIPIITASAQSIPYGNEATVSRSGSDYNPNFEFGIPEGFSPSIAVKTNTSSEYILSITTSTGSYDTPNLKGEGTVVDIPLATLSAIGGVKSSLANDHIKVEGDGSMIINSINCNKLYQNVGEDLILGGGGAPING